MNVAVRPKGHLPSIVFLLLALTIGLSYWVGAAVFRPDVSLDQAILFYPGGDPDYMPQVSALSRFNLRETSILEGSNSGVRSFPLASVFVHAALVSVFGNAGFVIADVLFVILFALALSYILQLAGITRHLAEALALIIISKAALIVRDLLGSTRLGSLPIDFWYTRFPRPVITEVFVVVFMVLAIRLAADWSVRRNASNWILVGLTWACLVQSDIYQAMNMGMVAGCVAVYLLVKDTKAAVRGLLIGGIAATVACIPFVFQRMHESPDIPRRWGMYSVGHKWILMHGSQTIAFALLVILFQGFICYGLGRPKSARARAACLITGGAVLATMLSGPLSVFALGKVIQTNHYPQRTQLAIGYVLLICAGWIIQGIGRWMFTALQVREHSARLIGSALAACVAIGCTAVAVKATRYLIRDEHATAPSMIQFLNTAESRYKSSFTELHEVLSRPEFNKAEVLGTFDVQLANWWEYRNKHLYLPDVFNTTVRDSEIERRVYGYLRLLDVRPDDFNELLSQDYFQVRVLSCAKYQANEQFTPSPIEDYTPDAQARIARTSIMQPWHIELPVSERARLIEAYVNFAPVAERVHNPDIYVLTKDQLRPFLHPERGRLALAWSNEIFEVWVPEPSGQN
jgi:hypothetical protein